jgi:hypothetical protein
MEIEAFGRTRLDYVIVPENVSFIAFHAFPRDYAVISVDVQDAHRVDAYQDWRLPSV